MGWQDYHLHMFEIGGERFELFEDGEHEPENGCQDERKRTLAEILTKGMQFTYVYDFGDDWEHAITVEDVLRPASGSPAPLCIDGARACPPEDCGGPYGYPNFLEALSDPDHPEHSATAEWARGFEPEQFNIGQANQLIEAVCALYRERGWGFQKE